MNLFFKSYRGVLFFFLFITWESGYNIVFAQSADLYLTPWIQEIEIPAPSREIACNSLLTDHHGHVLLGQENGIIIMGGQMDHQILMKGPVYISGNASDTLVYAASGDVGFLVPDRETTYKPSSRKHWIPASKRDFVPRGMELFGDQIFILTDRGVISLRESTFRLHEFGEPPQNMFQENGKLVVLLEDKGVFVWNGKGFVQRTEDGNPEGVLGSTRETDLFHPQRIGNYFIAKDPKGINILDKRGRILNRMGARGGLPDREIRQIIVNDMQEVWILSAHSLHKFSYPSSLNILNLEASLTGRILNSTLTGDTVYLGTGNGLWRVMREGEGTDLMHLENVLPGVSEPIHLLSAGEGQMYAAGTRHLFMVGGDHVEQLGAGSFTGIAAMGVDSVVAGNRDGIILYSKGPSGWRSERINAALSSATSFVFFQDRLYFLCENSVYRLNPDSYEAVKLQFGSGEMPHRLVPFEEELFLVCNEQIYSFNSSADTFIPAPSDEKTKMIAYPETLAPVPEETPIPVLGNLGKILRVAFHDSIVFITGRDKIALFDLSRLNSQRQPGPVQLIPQRGEGGDGSVYVDGLWSQKTPEPLFRYKLTPGDQEWSGWRTDRTILTSNLKHGKYQLEVQALDLYGRVTQVAGISFEIPTPVYLRWYAIVIYAILLLVVLFLIQKLRMLSYQRAETKISRHLQAKIDQMALEKAKSDKLAAEFLPEETAEELKSSGRARWKKYERATVLFSDIQGFTKIAEEMNPEALIDELDKFFFHFDSVVDKYNIEKIKTIGDAYMAAGGIPEKNSTNPVEVVLAAIEMQAYMAQLKASRTNIWDLRIGIHTGPVIAGVVGQKKVSYDIWGDTVNTASRMESSGVAGKVNISGYTHGLVKEYFICEYRGKLPVKYKGNIAMYFVKGLRPELSVDLKALPNKRFFTRLQLLRLADVEEKVFDEVLAGLPETYHFHNADHIRKVYNQSLLLGRAQETEQEERLLVRTAALMLFTGLTRSYNNFENNSVEIVREILPHYQYSETQIDQICNLILSTKMPFQPENLLEKIVIDARMEYLGCNDYTNKIALLFRELRESGVKINGQQFKHQHLELLHDFEYYTLAARRLREVSGPDQMTRLEKERWI